MRNFELLCSKNMSYAESLCETGPLAYSSIFNSEYILLRVTDIFITLKNPCFECKVVKQTTEGIFD